MKGMKNKAKYFKCSRFEIGCLFESLYLEKKKKHYPIPILDLNVLIYMYIFLK